MSYYPGQKAGPYFSYAIAKNVKNTLFKYDKNVKIVKKFVFDRYLFYLI